MIPKALLKQTRQLHQKKFRNERGCFIVEGEKLIDELFKSDFIIQDLFITDEWIIPSTKKAQRIHHVTPNELHEISALESPNKGLAVAVIKENPGLIAEAEKRYLMLDGIRDPGNMGTLLRIADWFGIHGIFCSNDCVEIYNPKVVQASMGSIFRVPVSDTNLMQLLKDHNDLTVYGAVLHGTSIYETHTEKGWILIIGNESTGISEELLDLCTAQVSIPSYSASGAGAESLNAAVAAAVICSEFSRRK
jgi:TrmH family RNA methyltransferase